MTTGDGLRRLADLLDALDTTDVDVLDVSVAGGDENALFADLRVEVPVDGAVDPAAVAGRADGVADAVDADGSDEHDASGPGDAPAGNSEHEGVERPADARSAGDADGDGATAGDETEEPSVTDVAGGDGADGVPCRAPDCEETFETEHGMKIHHTKVHGPSPEEEQPAYRDPDRLREAYEAHDSFAGMRDALGVDVSAQTVRRNAIRHGIHEPAVGDDAAADGDEADEPAGPEGEPEPAGTGPEESAADEDRGTAVDGGRDVGADARADEAALPDVDLPDGIELGDVKAAVESASTLYEVQQALGVDRERATALLRDLGLLELVHGRVATKRRRDDLKEEIDQRIRERAASG